MAFRVGTMQSQEKKPSQLQNEMEQLLEIEKKIFKERVELQEEVNKQPGHKQKLAKLKQLMEESYA